MADTRLRLRCANSMVFVVGEPEVCLTSVIALDLPVTGKEIEDVDIVINDHGLLPGIWIAKSREVGLPRYTADQYRNAYAYLRWSATMQTTVGYQELSNEAQLGLDMHMSNDRAIIGELLGDISISEHNSGRPMLSAIVITVQHQRVSSGFWVMTDHLGVVSVGATDAVKLAFETSQRQAVFTLWHV